MATIIAHHQQNAVNGHHNIQTQLTRSLEKILDEANQSGELRLSNRKLKDFPKASNEKYNLSDTVVADLSKNRFSELPEEITTFHFLEKLHCYHNTIRYVPDTIANLQCLLYLDLSRNQLQSLPRELCQLPIKILLVSNNNLTHLPDELNRMSQLTELDASCNQLTHLPPRLGDLRSLQSLVLRNNSLLAVPIEITFLKLVRLDLRANRIQTLPIEIRDMDTLIDLSVDDNPLTNPPASLCKRGRVHIFKYLENEAVKFDRKISGGTLGRRNKTTTRNLITSDRLIKRQNVDSGYSTSSDCFDLGGVASAVGTTNGGDKGGTNSWNNSPILETRKTTIDEDCKEKDNSFRVSDPYLVPPLQYHHGNEGGDVVEGVEGDEVESSRQNKQQPLHQIQTYREYKEALKQQRAHDVPSIYHRRTPLNSTADDQSNHELKNNKTEPNTPTHHNHNNYYNNNNHTGGQIKNYSNMATSKSDPTPLNSLLSGSSVTNLPASNNKFGCCSDNNSGGKTSPFKSSPRHDGNNANKNISQKIGQQHYIKPQSPVAAFNGGGNIRGTSPRPYLNGGGDNTAAPGKINGVGVKITTTHTTTTRNISWGASTNGGGHGSGDKMTFTMRREIDKAREESDLINQLRNIIESRLKMTLPVDLASALTDGVVLCHLANHIKPRSVASIHVPSPAVPKLTMARCRRNVDNFIDACRKIGVDESWLCTTLDVTEGLVGGDSRGLPRLLDCLTALVTRDVTSPTPVVTMTTSTITSRPTTINDNNNNNNSKLQDATVSFLLLSLFIATVALLVIFPPPEY